MTYEPPKSRFTGTPLRRPTATDHLALNTFRRVVEAIDALFVSDADLATGQRRDLAIVQRDARARVDELEEMREYERSLFRDAVAAKASR